MDVSYDVTSALRTEMHHHEPIVLIRGGRCACGFIPRESGKTRSIGYWVEVLPTMNADGNYAVLVYDARGNGGGRTAPTIIGDHQDRVTDYTAIVVKYEETIQQGKE